MAADADAAGGVGGDYTDGGPDAAADAAAAALLKLSPAQRIEAQQYRFDPFPRKLDSPRKALGAVVFCVIAWFELMHKGAANVKVVKYWETQLLREAV